MYRAIPVAVALTFLAGCRPSEAPVETPDGSLVAQDIGDDPALEARTEDRESWNRQFDFLTTCEDYLGAGEAQQRGYIAGMNQAFFYAVEMVAIEVEMGLVVEAAGGDAVADIQIPAVQAARVIR